MNVFGKSERSWRKARKRAVSPIIATILLVAITVVLAAVLYVLISGLTSGGVGSKPIGSAFSAGNPVSSYVSGTAAAPACTATTVTGTTATTLASMQGYTVYEYTLTVESSTITMSSALFEVKAANGAIYTDAVASAFYIVNIASQIVACQALAAGAMAMTSTFSTFSGATNCNSLSCSTSTPLTTIYTIVIDLGELTASPAGTGLTFVAIGTGSYSGTTAALTLP